MLGGMMHDLLNFTAEKSLKYYKKELWEAIKKESHYTHIWQKLWEIKKILDKYKPKNVFELGSGWSTAVFNDNRRNVWTYEENYAYKVKTQKLCPDARILRKDKVVENESCYYMEEWDKFPQIMTNEVMAYVDGPSNNEDGKLLPCVDIINMCEAAVMPKIIVFDVRVESFQAFINTKWIAMYEIKEFGRFIDKNSHKHHTILERYW
jgi:hypothetical protein